MTDTTPSVLHQNPNWPSGLFNFGALVDGSIRYFNPTCIHRPDGDWLIARKSEPLPPSRRKRVRADLGQNSLAAFRLDPQHRLEMVPHKVQFPHRYQDEHFEDPRASIIRNRVCISCTNFQLDPAPKWFGSHQLFAITNEQWKVTVRVDPIYGMNGASPYVQRGSEKNWLWFEHENAIHMVYTAVPHQVAVFTKGERADRTHATKLDKEPWKYGTIRGGTPPVRVDDEYWTFFHSSLPWQGKKRRYYMGAYAFQAMAPFHITRMTPKPLLTGSQQDPWAPGLPLVIFPGGAIFRNGTWFVVYGVNDCRCGWIEIPHEELVRLSRKTKSVELFACQDISGAPMTTEGQEVEANKMTLVPV